MINKRLISRQQQVYLSFLLLMAISLQGCGLLGLGGKPEATAAKSAEAKQVKMPTLSDREQQLFQRAYFEGLKEKHIGNTSRAIQNFRRALKVNPGAEAANYELSRLLQDRKAGDSAVMHARKAVSLSDSGYWYLKHLSELYRDQNRYQKAAPIMEQIIKVHEEGPRFYYQLANVYIRQDKLDLALKTYERFEENFGVDPQVVRQQKRIYLQQNKVEKAAEAVRGLIEANPNRLKYYHQLAKLYQANGKTEKAKSVYDEMLKIAPQNGQTQMALAQYYSKQGNQQKAFQKLKKAFQDAELGIDKKVKFMLSNYLRGQLNAGQREQAFKLARILTEAHPNSAKAHATYGDLYYQNNKLDKALKAYEKAIQYTKDNFSVWQNLLQIYLRERRYQELEQQSSRALTYFPNQPVLYYFHGLGLKENGKKNKAVQQFESGLSLVSGNQNLKTQLFSNLGMTYHDMGAYEASEKNFEKALKLNPGDPFILNNYSWYLALRGDSLTKAEEMSAKTLKKRPGNSAYLDTYGWIQYKKGNYQKAKTYIGRALEQSPNDPELLEHFGDVHYQLDQVNEAVMYWKRAKTQGGDEDKLEQKVQSRQLLK